MERKNLSRSLTGMTISFFTSLALTVAACIVVVQPDLGRPDMFPEYTVTVLVLFDAVAGLAFYIYLGVLAKALGRSWIIWVGLSFIFKPVGGIIAYVFIRHYTKRAISTEIQ